MNDPLSIDYHVEVTRLGDGRLHTRMTHKNPPQDSSISFFIVDPRLSELDVVRDKVGKAISLHLATKLREALEKEQK